MPPPSSPVFRVIVEYDDDPIGAADALLAVLKRRDTEDQLRVDRRQAEEHEVSDDEAA
jgi:hypothetical protein